MYFQNPFFYLQKSNVDGWGWYSRGNYDDIREILNTSSMYHHTFVESITEVEREILKGFGFGSFFRYHNPGSQTSE